jgi:S-methylmethionine-dependent homocysteine/selenocysteine methylase
MTTTSHPHNNKQADRRLSFSDAGMETVLIFENGFDLPEFASFPLLDRPEGRSALLAYYQGFVDIADSQNVDLVLDTATWRASQGWGEKLGYDAEALERINREAVVLLEQVRADRPPDAPSISISGAIGPAGDGYTAHERLSVEDAMSYHQPQLQTFAQSGVDMATGLTLTYIDEGIGLALAAKSVGIPVVVSFTVETDGSLPSGQTLKEAIEAVDSATDNYPNSYGINCAHPEHFGNRLSDGEDWCNRIGLIQANASRMSHQELDNAPELDPGNPTELAANIAELRDWLPELAIVGGCCGTSHIHIEQIARACAAPTSATPES